MAKFKEGHQQRSAFSMYAKPLMWVIINALDAVSVILGYGEIVITEGIRNPQPGEPSYHPVGLAFDMRVWGTAKIERWKGTRQKKRFMDAIIKALTFLKEIDDKIYWVWEDKGKKNEHLHVGYAEGKKK